MNEKIIENLVLVVLMIAAVEAIAQNTIKQSEPKSIYLLFGLISYMGVGYLLHYAYHRYPLSKINVIWSALSIVLAALFGYLLYDEPINGELKLAILLALMAVYFAYKS